MEAEFQGFEIDTPLGGISAGRGYSRSAGEDYFQGLAIRLPIGRLRIGRRMWEEPAHAYEQPVPQLLKHIATAVIVVPAVYLLDRFLPGEHYVWWLAGIWAVILVLHGFQVLVGHVWPRESSGASPAGDPEDRDDRNR